MKMRARLQTNHMNLYSNVTKIVEKEVMKFEHSLIPGTNKVIQKFASAKNCMYEGLYSLHLKRLLNAGIKLSNIKIYWSETFFTNTSQTMKDALQWLGLNPEQVKKSEFQKTFNASPIKTPTNLKISANLKKHMYDIFEPFDKELENILGETPPWRNRIQRKIWMLWDKGLKNAPNFVKQCHRSWTRKNPDHTVHMLNLKEAEELINRKNLVDDETWLTMPIEAKSDVIRSFLLTVTYHKNLLMQCC